MSIMKRMRDITVATLNERLEKAEDPVKLIDSYLLSQREQIMQSEQLYKQCVMHSEAMKRQFFTAQELVYKREEQALIAVRAGEEEIARIALQEKMLNEERAAQYKDLYEQALTSVTDVEERLQQLRADYDEVIAKRQYYAARMESIRLQQKMNERFGEQGFRGSEQAFRRLEDRVSDWEMETKALNDLRRMTQDTLYRAGTAVKETLDIELRKLKAKLEKEGWTKS